jgi:hypothetical protein
MGFFFLFLFIFRVVVVVGQGKLNDGHSSRFLFTLGARAPDCVYVCVQFANPKHELASATKIPDGNCAKLFESFRHSKRSIKGFPPF